MTARRRLLHQLDNFLALLRIGDSNECPQQSKGFEVFSGDAHHALIRKIETPRLAKLCGSQFNLKVAIRETRGGWNRNKKGRISATLAGQICSG